MREETEAVFKQLMFPTGKSPDIYEDVVEQFERYFKLQTNYLQYKVQFINRSQKKGGSFEAYIKELHMLAS